MKGKQESYQQEINTVSSSILVRLEHYRKIMYEVRPLLITYFFDTTRTKKLTEPVKGEQKVFNFDSVKKSMEHCLADESTLLATTQEIKKEGEDPRFTEALDKHISESGLPIKQQESGFYIFNPKTPYTPEAQTFMQQFAYALSIYRVCLGVCEILCSIHCHKWPTDNFQDYLVLANNSNKELKGEIDLIALYKKTKVAKKEITSKLRAEKIYAGADSFKEDTDFLAQKLVGFLEAGKTYLERSYKEFPNNAILWILHDRSWHSLLKELSARLFVNSYTYSTLSSSLEIKSEFIELIKKEVEDFSAVTKKKIPLLKIEILKKAAQDIGMLKIDLLSQLAELGIELVEAPKGGIFTPSVTLDIYRLYSLKQQLSEETSEKLDQKISKF